jgi:hypothetical protein
MRVPFALLVSALLGATVDGAGQFARLQVQF